MRSTIHYYNSNLFLVCCILFVGEVIDEVGDDTLFEPLSPDAVGYSDQDDLQVPGTLLCCYSSQLLNKYLKIDVF